MSQVLEVVQCDETAGPEVGGTNIVGGLMVSGRADARRHFEALTDPRRGQVKYPLVNVMVMTLCAVISGADDFVAVAFWAGKNRAWLEQFLDLSSGIPSHDCFNSIFARLSPAEFQQCLLNWITALHEVTGGQVIAIDGKTLRRSFDKASSKSAIHMVSAFATASRISLGQVVTDAKSNEITAIPKLLDIVNVQGAVVTIDAMGCQTEIVDKITSQGAVACIAVKTNQPKLHAAIAGHFDQLIEDGLDDANARRASTRDHGHGREEHRSYVICPVPASVKELGRWKHVRAIGMATSVITRDGKEYTGVRYYILTRYLSGRRFAEAARGHWGIENSLHWQLDVTFGEDQCRIRKGHADANFSLIRRFALGMLKNEKSAGVGIKNKRLLAAWDQQYLAKVLFG